MAMAFNPFHAFRKNSKPMMAALTIFVMGIFVLSSGGGGADFFDWIPRFLGGNDARGPILGSVDGTDYRLRTLNEIRHKRMAANAFMSAAVARVDMRLDSKIREDLQNNVIKDQAARTPIEAGPIPMTPMM